ncbi:filamentous hemagglutinin N-terminal domain-containing protein, partial [bacterium]|nr:filamentous hemagglutinin N-terminal domain-containing protein [bacterium]
MTKNFKKSLAFAMCLTFMSMQTTLASMDTGLGNGIGGAVINGTNGGFVDMQTGNNSATLNFDGNTYVNWDSLNLNSNETLNFNAVNGANGINILNSVTGTGMSQIYGTINSNAGINQLIISNPNGVLFDGASFNAAGDVMLTTQQLGAEFNGSNMTIVPGSNAAINGVVIKDSSFNVGGEFVISAPSIDVLKTAITTGSGLKLVTRDGQNYLVTNVNGEEEKGIKVDAVSVNGNIYVLSGKDYVQFKNGGTIKGDLTVDSQGIVAVNYTDPEEKTLTITGNANIKSNGALNPRDKGNFMYL